MKVNVINYPNQNPTEIESKENFNNDNPKKNNKKKALKDNYVTKYNRKEEETNIKNDNKGSRKNKIIIITILVLLIIAIFVILYFKIFKNLFNNLINEIKPEKPPMPLIEDPHIKDIIFLNNTYNFPLETPLKNIISGYSYEEIETKINSSIIFENNILLNDIINNINDYLILNDSDIEIITNISEIVYSPPEILINPTKNSLKIVKDDIAFYKSKYEELSKFAYNFTINASESINNIYYSLNDTKEELISLLYQFKENIKNISIPFILEKGELFNKIEINKNISLKDEMEDYKNETNNLNNLYNKLFKYINEEIQIIFDEINEIKNFYLDLQRYIEDEKEIFIKKLKEFNNDEDNQKYHEILIQIKNYLISIKEEIIKKKIQFKERMNSFEIQRRKIDLEELIKDCDKIIENINSKMFSIKNLINRKRMLNNDKSNFDEPILYASNIISDFINNAIYIIIRKINSMEIKAEEDIETFSHFDEVEEKTSLDLLFIMDLSCSMNPYYDQAKNNIINIMNRITFENPGINVSVGFIGYIDIDVYGNPVGNYVNIDFTLNHTELEEKIPEIIGCFYNGDLPEDMAWGFEMALDKNWKYNARAIVLIADYPCHGTKYHTMDDIFPNGSPNRKNIEKSIEELAKNNVSLYCIRILEYSEKMFQIFSDIYKNYTTCNFMVVNMDRDSELPEIIINASSKTYIEQRNNG